MRGNVKTDTKLSIRLISLLLAFAIILGIVVTPSQMVFAMDDLEAINESETMSVVVDDDGNLQIDVKEFGEKEDDKSSEVLKEGDVDKLNNSEHTGDNKLDNVDEKDNKPKESKVDNKNDVIEKKNEKEEPIKDTEDEDDFDLDAWIEELENSQLIEEDLGPIEDTSKIDDDYQDFLDKLMDDRISKVYDVIDGPKYGFVVPMAASNMVAPRNTSYVEDGFAYSYKPGGIGASRTGVALSGQSAFESPTSDWDTNRNGFMQYIYSFNKPEKLDYTKGHSKLSLDAPQRHRAGALAYCIEPNTDIRWNSANTVGTNYKTSGIYNAKRHTAQGGTTFRTPNEKLQYDPSVLASIIYNANQKYPGAKGSNARYALTQEAIWIYMDRNGQTYHTSSVINSYKNTISGNSNYRPMPRSNPNVGQSIKWNITEIPKKEIEDLLSKVNADKVSWDLEIKKTGENGKLLQGAEFIVSESPNMTNADRITTNSNGIARWSTSARRPYNGVVVATGNNTQAVVTESLNGTKPDTSKEAREKTVYIQEVKAPDGYQIDNTKHEVVLDFTDTTRKQIVIKNDPDKVELVLNKVNDNGNGIAKAEFNLINSNGNRVRVKSTGAGEYTVATSSDPAKYDFYTDNNGKVTIKGLQPGKTYTFKEVSVPVPYSLAPEKSVTTPTSGSRTVEIKDKRQLGNINITKINSLTNRTIGGAEFKLQKRYGDKEVYRFTGSNGEYKYNPNGAVTTLRAPNGTLKLTDVPIGYELQLIETKAPTGFILDPTPHNIKFTHDKTTIDKVYHTINLTVGNEPSVVKGTIPFKLYKLGNTVDNEAIFDKALAGVEFNISAINENDNSIVFNRNVTTNQLGVIFQTMSGVELDKNTSTKIRFTVKETKGKDGYYQPTKPFVFTVDISSTDTTLNIRNATIVDKGDYPYLTASVDSGEIVGRVGNNIKHGYISVEKKDRDTGRFLAGARFDIKDSTGQVVDTIITNVLGRATSKKLPVGEYTVQERVAPRGYEIDVNSSKNVTVKAEETSNLTFENIKTQLTINKVDAKTKEPIKETVTFKMYDSDKNLMKFSRDGGIGRLRYNESGHLDVEVVNGKVIISSLPKGNYTLVESKPANGYQIDTTPTNISITDTKGEGNEYTIENKQVEIELSKTDLVDSKVVEGATIILTGPSFKDGKEFITDKNGKINIEGLEFGNYTFKEKIHPNGYTLNRKEYNFTVTDEGKIEGDRNFTNDPTRFELVKSNEDGKKLENVEFELHTVSEGLESINGTLDKVVKFTFDKEHNRYIASANGTTEKLTTNKDGKIIVDYLPQGEYILKETKQIPGYISEKIEKEIVITEDTNTTKPLLVEITNKPIEVELSKTDLVDDKPVEGATIILTGPSFPEGKEFITDKNGKINIKEIIVGKYTFKEKVHPEGYVLNTESFEFVVKEDGTIEGTTDFTNDPTRLTVEKYNLNDKDKKDKERLSDVEFELRVIGKELEDENGNLTNVVRFNFDKENNRYVANANGEFSVLTTDEKGTFNVDYLPQGKYELVEVKNKEGFILDSTPVKVEITEDTSTTTPLLKEIYNKENEVELTKTDLIDEDPIEGATIIITGPSFPEGKEFITDSNGKININRLKPGKYTFQEKVHPEGYVLNTESFEFIVEEDGTITGTTDFTNDPTRLEVIKYNEDDENEDKERLSDVEFELRVVGKQLEDEDGKLTNVVRFNYDKKNDRYIANAKGEFKVLTTDKNGEFKVDYLPQGEYELVEVKNKAGFVLKTEPIKIEITEETSTTTPLLELIYNKENEVELTKTDLIDEDPIPGATIIITGPSFPEGKEFVTDSNGKINIKRLIPGKYTFKEKVHPEGYVLNTESFEFVVEEDGTITGTTDFTNDPTRLTVIKVNEKDLDKEDKERLSDVEFELRVVGRQLEDEDGNLTNVVRFNFDEKHNRYVANATGEFKTLKTNEEGTFDVDYLPQGEYELVEVKNKEGFLLDNTPIKVKITEETSTTTPLLEEISNKENEVELTKTDLIDEDPIEGATIIITGPSFPEGKEFITDSNGKININRLKHGKYTFQEKVHPEGYVLNTESFEFVVEEDGTITGTTDFTNDPTRLVVEKYNLNDKDKEDKEIIAGVEFELRVVGKELEDENGNLTNVVRFNFDEKNDRYVANANGEFKVLTTNDKGTFKVDYLPQGEYELVEVKNKEGFLLDSTPIKVEITEETSTTTPLLQDVYNKENEVELTKTDLINEDPVEGATIIITGPSFPEGKEFITDSNGKININRLDHGKYTFKEKVHPEGYVLNTETFEFIVKEDGTIEGTTDFTNDPTRVVIEKVDANDNDILIEGAKFELHVIDRELEDEDGNTSTIIKTNYDNDNKRYTANAQGEFSILETDENGQIVVDYLPQGKYKFVEVESAPGYVFEEKVVEFEITEETSTTTPFKDTVENTPVVVEIVKTDSTTEEFVSGATIEIFNKDGKSMGNAITDENGIARFEGNNFVPGEYTYKEVEAPIGYTINNKEFKFTIDNEGKVEGELEFTNNPTSLIIEKLDSKSKKALEGVEFEIRKDGKAIAFTFDSKLNRYIVSENGNTTLRTNEKGLIRVDYLPIGKYEIVETKALKGYDKLTKSIKVEIDENSSVEKPTKTTILNKLTPPTPPSKQTGDMFNAGILLIISLILVSIIVLVIGKKRLNK